MSNINFNCDVCGREVSGCTYVNGMKFCAKCYQETFGASKDWQLLDKDKTIAEQQKQIADLEAKLAEYETEIKSLSSEISSLEQDLTHYKGEVYNLKDQLIEKEKLIDEYADSVSTVLIEKANLSCRQDRDKISFAVEQLEKVKEKVICGVMDISNDCWSCFVKDGSQYMTSEDLNFALEQEFTFQIQELKKEMK